MAPDTLVQTLPRLPSPPPYINRPRVPTASPHNRVLENKFTTATVSKHEEEEDAFVIGIHKPQRKPAISATHELRALRSEAASLEAQLASLCVKWQQSLPDQVVREGACMAAKNKWISSQAELLNRSLKDQMLQQQLYLASLQHLMTQSPFLTPSRSKELFEGMHSFSALPATLSIPQRLNHLQAQCELGVRLVPALMGRFTRQHLHEATPSNPFSHTSIMADGNYTYVSNILLCRISRRSLDAVTAATLSYFQNLSPELRRHLGVQCDLEMIHDLGEMRGYSQLRYRNGSRFAAASNTTLAAKFTPDSAIVVADFVDQDDRHPIDRTSEDRVGMDSCLSLLMTPEKNLMTGCEEVLVQRLTVNQYNLPPTSPRLHDEIRSTLPWFNGDLFMEIVCRHLEQSGSPKALQS
ncbi:hypothetical protein BBJ29_006988 [Phytophthora kernoviae]|uniref:Uncharacterized protein n=1 Tax=Phytophthora kernoviae TaxID=325452 RepID=A0A3F2RYI6_9STRA|nr:hypothetical protein BBJ29_006988 [Phytophthora kernoviae]RLN65863.1 hypothetical protein BBP00_00002611 [Phytophthora kernoviae]